MNHRIVVTSRRFPYLPVRVEVHGFVYEGYALLDTGFDGDVILPERCVSDIGAAGWHRHYILADGSEVRAPIYDGSLAFNGLGPFPSVIAVIGDEALIGVHAIRRFRVILDHGQRVVVEP